MTIKLNVILLTWPLCQFHQHFTLSFFLFESAFFRQNVTREKHFRTKSARKICWWNWDLDSEILMKLTLCDTISYPDPTRLCDIFTFEVSELLVDFKGKISLESKWKLKKNIKKVYFCSFLGFFSPITKENILLKNNWFLHAFTCFLNGLFENNRLLVCLSTISR